MRARLIIVFIVVVALAGLLLWSTRTRVPDGLARRTSVLGGREVGFIVMRLPTSLREYSFVADPENPRTVRQWRQDLGAEIVFNGSYFKEGGFPSGYWKTGKGESAVPWPSPEERADPHGYTFSLSAFVNGLRMDYLPANPVDETIDETFLSFPTLVAEGAPMVEADSGQLARRTVVAMSERGDAYLIVTEKGTLSLYQLSQWLVAQPERFVIAGNLDGGPSTGASIENGDHDVEVLSAPVPNVVAVFNRSDR